MTDAERWFRGPDNNRRAELIAAKYIDGSLSPSETAELAELQAEAKRMIDADGYGTHSSSVACGPGYAPGVRHWVGRREPCPNQECSDGLVPVPYSNGLSSSTLVPCPTCKGWGYRDVYTEVPPCPTDSTK